MNRSAVAEHIEAVRAQMKRFWWVPRCWCVLPDGRWLMLYHNPFRAQPNWFIGLYDGAVEILNHPYRDGSKAQQDFERRAEMLIEEGEGQ